jgi:hypothetical protein
MISYSHVLDIPIYRNALHLVRGVQDELVIFHEPVEVDGDEVVVVETFKYLSSCGSVIMNVCETREISAARKEWKDLIDLGYERFDMRDFSCYE